MRCFVALPVPPAIAALLAGLTEGRRAALPRARWSHRDDLHVTLQFLGEVGSEQVPEIAEALRSALVDVGSLELRVAEFGVFSGAGVLLASMEPSAELLQLTRTVAEALRGCGFLPELRPFRPHITMARTRRSLPVEDSLRWIGPIEPPVRVPCVEVALYQSGGAPTSAEPRYTQLSTAPLQLPSTGLRRRISTQHG